MQVTKIYFLSIIVILSACKKEQTTASLLEAIPVDDCTVQMSPSNGDIINGRYIIALKDDANARMMSAQDVSRYSTGVLQRNNIRSTVMLRSFRGEPSGFVANLSAEEVSRLKTDPGIDIIEQDRVIALGSCFTVAEPSLITWNVNRVGYGDGRGKTAWIIDTGIDFTHPDLNVDSARSRSFITGQPSARDENGHGTHVAGIIGARNNNFGILGVASDASLVSLRVLEKDGMGTVGAVIDALAYVNQNGKAGDVVNFSAGEDTILTILDREIQNTAAKGIYIAIAAGNENKPASDYSPGRANGTNIYTVSAIDSLDNFAGFSNYGNDVLDYAAPGVNIVSTWLDGQYAKVSGTSMATPHVAGLLLLVGKNIKSSGTANNDPDGVPDPIAHY